MSCVQWSEGGFQVVYPLGLWSRSSGVVVNYLHLHLLVAELLSGGFDGSAMCKKKEKKQIGHPARTSRHVHAGHRRAGALMHAPT